MTRGRLGGGGAAADEAMECEVAVLGAKGGVAVAAANVLGKAKEAGGGASVAGAGSMAIELGAGRRTLLGATSSSLGHHARFGDGTELPLSSAVSLPAGVYEGAAADGSDVCAMDTARGVALRMIVRALGPLTENSIAEEPGTRAILRKLNLGGNGIDSGSGAVLRSLFGAVVRLDYGAQGGDR